MDRDGDLQAQWLDASRAVTEALSDEARASKVVGGMFGEQSFESLVGRMVCADLLTHTWDLARATGQDESLDPAAVSAARDSSLRSTTRSAPRGASRRRSSPQQTPTTRRGSSTSAGAPV